MFPLHHVAGGNDEWAERRERLQRRAKALRLRQLAGSDEALRACTRLLLRDELQDLVQLLRHELNQLLKLLQLRRDDLKHLLDLLLLNRQELLQLVELLRYDLQRLKNRLLLETGG